MKLEAAVAALEDLVPLRFAESWDNVGLLLGDPAQEVTRAMFCVDLTPAVVDEAAAARCELVVAYHPP
jgi:putative NIF3 family GTP cyclohydrolase 1 type 2